MADTYCEACVTLQNDAPDFVQNGVTSAIDTRLRNDHGFAAKSSVDTDCEALNLANDCLVGFMEDETEAYDTCEWKTWSARFAGNVHKVIDATISAVCGLWTKVHNLLSRVSALEDAQSNVCDVLSGVTNLVTGEPQRHRMTTVPNILGYRDSTPSFFYLMAEQKTVSICNETVRLQGYSAVYDGAEIFFKTAPYAGMVLAHISKLSIVGSGYMDSDYWDELVARGDDFFQLYGYDYGYAQSGYIIQTRLSSDPNYPDELTIRIRAIINGSNVSGTNVNKQISVGNNFDPANGQNNPTLFNRSRPPIIWEKLN